MTSLEGMSFPSLDDFVALPSLHTCECDVYHGIPPTHGDVKATKSPSDRNDIKRPQE